MRKINHTTCFVGRQGFTLIELLVVIAIIGLLSTLAVVSLNNARSKARDARRTSDLKAMQSALELYRADNNDAVPNSGTGGLADWAALSTALALYLPAGAPTDPSTSSTYVFCSELVGTAWNYVLGATLENSSSNYGGLNGTANYAITTCLKQTTGKANAPTCAYTVSVPTINYCIGSLSS